MILNEMYYFLISYILIIIIGFMLINFLSNGFFGTFLRIKASRGKKVLVEVHAITDVYFKAGKFDGTLLKYKTREKKNKALEVTAQQVFRKLGVFCVITDDVSDAVLDIEFKAHSGGDSETYDHLLKRVIMAPQIENMREKIILGLLVIILIAVVISTVLIFNASNQLTELLTGARSI